MNQLVQGTPNQPQSGSTSDLRRAVLPDFRTSRDFINPHMVEPQLSAEAIILTGAAAGGIASRVCASQWARCGSFASEPISVLFWSINR